MFSVTEERTDRGAKFYRLVFDNIFVDIREDWKFPGVKHQLERFVKKCEEDAKIVERDYGTKGVSQPVDPKPVSEVLVNYEFFVGDNIMGGQTVKTCDRYPNCTFEVNNKGLCRIYDSNKKLIASVRGWKKVVYA